MNFATLTFIEPTLNLIWAKKKKYTNVFCSWAALQLKLKLFFLYTVKQFWNYLNGI